jgi:hypothetical protein
MAFLKYLCLLAVPSLLLGLPARAENYNEVQTTAAKIQKNKHDTANTQIQKMRIAPPRGSTGPTVPPKPTQGNAKG